MQYIKHYYVDENNNTFCCDTNKPQYKRHPWKEYANLDVKVWLLDSEGIDVCLAELPDSTPVSTIVSDCGKKAVQVLTEQEYNSVANIYFEFVELSLQAQFETDKTLKSDLYSQAEEKYQEATAALHSL
jgi:hypothetical protein